MNKKLFALCALLIISPVPLLSELAPETVADTGAAKSLTDQIMTRIIAGDLNEAFNIMKRFGTFSPTEIDSAALQYKAAREKYGPRDSQLNSFEAVDSKKVGNSLLRLRYIEKTKLHALSWNFFFYQTKEGWILDSFNWHETYNQLFDNN